MYLEKKITLRIDNLGKSEEVTFKKGEGGNIFIEVNGIEESVSVEDFIDILDSLFDLTGKKQ